jgi:hypothetical protein
MLQRWNYIASAFQRGKSILKVYPFARLSRRAVKWFSVTIAVVVVVPVLLLSTRRVPAPAARVEPARTLRFTLVAEGDRLGLDWDREAPAIQDAQCGVLWIADGSIHRRVILDASQLRAGKLFYWPVNKDVSFEITTPGRKSGDAVCGNNATPLLQPAEDPTRPPQQADRTASHKRLNKIQKARESIESPESEDASGNDNARIESSSVPTFVIEESPLIPTFPVHHISFPVVSEQPMLSTAISPVPQVALEPYSTVTVEAVPESRLGRIVGKMPLWRRLHRTTEFLPPRPVRETAPAVPAELRQTLKSEVPLDVRAYVDKSGKVTYAELLSDYNKVDSSLASIAVFDARRWEFIPAQLGAHTVPGQVILHYRFGNPLLAVSRDQPWRAGIIVCFTAKLISPRAGWPTLAL